MACFDALTIDSCSPGNRASLPFQAIPDQTYKALTKTVWPKSSGKYENYNNGNAY
jgi:hypothetical protein